MSNKQEYSFIQNKIRQICGRITTAFDMLKDYKVCKCDLSQVIVSDDTEETGANDSMPMRYWALDRALSDETFTAEDSFIDIGCGKGRVLAYMLLKKHPCRLTGVELKEDIADFCRAWTQRYDNVEILCKNALEIDYNQYTYLFLFNPFTAEIVEKFVNYLESHLTRSIRLCFYGNSIFFRLVKDRPGWTQVKRGVSYKKGPLFIHYWPQKYAIYTYTPQ